MSKPLKYYIALLMSILLLVSTAGIPVFAHICKSDGFKELSVVPVENCCTDDSAPVCPDVQTCLDESDCCTDQVQVIQTQANAIKNLQQLKAEAPVFILLQLPSFLLAAAQIKDLSAHAAKIKSPPKSYGRGLLADISILRI